MKDYFVDITTFPAPIVGDRYQRYQTATDAKEALNQVVSSSRHGVGVYRAAAYDNADDFHRARNPSAEWESHQCQIDRLIHADNPKGGSFV